MTYKHNSLSLLVHLTPAFFNICTRYIMEGREDSMRIDSSYCLDAPEFMPAGGCRKFKPFGRGHGADFAEQIEVQRP